jgi:flagellar FliL protein
MAEKPEKKEAAPPADKNAPPAAAAAPVVAAAPAKGGLKAWLPTIVALVLAPAATWAVAQFVLLPKLQKTLADDDGKPAAAAAVAPAAAHPATPAGGKPGDKKGPETGPTYHFDNVVVNLAGTMGTRYLKTSFLVTGSDAALAAKFEAARPQLGDVTLAVLASLTLADLEEPGSKNIIREKLISAYNQALGQKLAENLYFSDFVVQ